MPSEPRKFSTANIWANFRICVVRKRLGFRRPSKRNRYRGHARYRFLIRVRIKRVPGKTKCTRTSADALSETAVVQSNTTETLVAQLDRKDGRFAGGFIVGWPTDDYSRGDFRQIERFDEIRWPKVVRTFRENDWYRRQAFTVCVQRRVRVHLEENETGIFLFRLSGECDCRYFFPISYTCP